MRSTIRAVLVLAVLATTALHAQDPECLWRGVINPGAAYRNITLDVTKSAGGGWKVGALMGPPGHDQGSITIPNQPSPIVLSDGTIDFAIDEWGVTYRGTISGNGYRIDGMWTQNGAAQRLVFYCPDRNPRNVVADQWPHMARSIRVEKDVQLEVVDWGGAARPLVLLHGMAATAHSLDAFASKLAAEYHVYVITRRGEGRSSVPDSGYSIDRLGDDVLAVMDTLHLAQAVIAGHSFGGQVLSDVASRHPERVAGAIYLDSRTGFVDPRRKDEYGYPLRDCPCSIPNQLNAGLKGFRTIPVPTLALFALKNDAAATAPVVFFGPARSDFDDFAVQAREFELGVPTARVVRLWPATHLIYESNEADVLREIRTFIKGLPEARR